MGWAGPMCVLVLACIYIHIHVHNNNSQRKEAINLRMEDMGGSLGGYLWGTGEKKREGRKGCNSISIKKYTLQKSKDKCHQEHRETGILACYGWEWNFMRPSWKIAGRLPYKFKIELSCDPAILLLGRHPKGMKSSSDLHFHGHHSLTHDCRHMEST